MKKIIMISVLCFPLLYCASINKEFINIKSGDTKAQAIRRVGPPEDRQFKGKNEALQYCTTGTSFGHSTFNIVWLYAEKVTGVSRYTVAHGGLCRGQFKTINWQDAPNP